MQHRSLIAYLNRVKWSQGRNIPSFVFVYNSDMYLCVTDCVTQILKHMFLIEILLRGWDKCSGAWWKYLSVGRCDAYQLFLSVYCGFYNLLPHMQNECCKKEKENSFQHSWQLRTAKLQQISVLRCFGLAFFLLQYYLGTSLFFPFLSSFFTFILSFPFLSSFLSFIPQILRQEAGEPWRRGGGGERSELGGGRLLVLDSGLCHLPAGSSKTAQRWATFQDVASRWIPPHHVWQTSQVRITTAIHWQNVLICRSNTGTRTFPVLIFDLIS